MSERGTTGTCGAPSSAEVTRLSREVDRFIRLDEGSRLIDFDHDFPDFFGVKCGTPNHHLKVLDVSVLYYRNL